ncbi:MAG TPA: VanZ family protein [Usitatibacter sp.]|nr:VanZ family protein [Usitatibacter sp.]
MTSARYRGSLAVWVLLIAYASLYPFAPLRPPTFEALSAFFVRPRYVIEADVALNVIAYVPLGTLACLYFRQSSQGLKPILQALALGAALSFAMEICQLFIPSRVASLYDVLANAGGAFFGALAFADPFYSLATRPLGELRERAVISGVWGDAGLVLLLLWLISQLNPALPFFDAGNIGTDRDSQLALLPWIAVALSVCAFGLFVSALLRAEIGSLRLTLVLLSIALWLKFLAASFMLQPHVAAEWLNVGRVVGLVAGIALFIPLRRLGRSARIYLALVLTLAGALFAKIFGAYSSLDDLMRVFRWPYGQLANFTTLTRFLHELWPFAALVYLIALFFHIRRAPPVK